MKKVLCIAALVAFMAPAAVTTVSAKAASIVFVGGGDEKGKKKEEGKSKCCAGKEKSACKDGAKAEKTAETKTAEKKAL